MRELPAEAHCLFDRAKILSAARKPNFLSHNDSLRQCRTLKTPESDTHEIGAYETAESGPKTDAEQTVVCPQS